MTRSKILLFTTAIGLFVLSTLLSFGYFSYHKVLVSSSQAATQLYPTNETPSSTPNPLDPYNILLLGHGGPDHSGGEITDTILVAQVIPRQKQVILISIPRDLWVPLPLDTSPIYRKINHAYALGNDSDQFPNRPPEYSEEAGGAELAKDMVELVTGLPIRFFAAINFTAFEQAINNLGGITVNVPVSFTDEYYPIKGLETDTCGKSTEEMAALEATLSGYKLEFEYTCRFETLVFEAGPTPMDGATALKYVRSRHSQTYGNDFARSERQQSVILALQQKFLSLGTLPKLVPLINTLTDNLRTDLGISELKTIWSTHGDLNQYTFATVNLSTDNVLTESRSEDNQYILIPSSGYENWQQIHTYIDEQLAAVASAPSE